MYAKNISRLDFLKAASLTLGVSSAACCGLGYAARRSSETPMMEMSGSAKHEVETPSFTYGKDSRMNSRILVAYATRTGSTVEVAEKIAETLAAAGSSVDVRPIQENPTLEGYSAVVLGSAINGAKWLPEAVQYVREHQAVLRGLPLALFCVHIMNLGDDDQSRAKRLAYLIGVRELVQPVDEAYFAGIGMQPDQASRFERWLYQAFKIGPEGDCRDWKMIRSWAGRLAPELQ
jgi:menaquinone-dependent protoporphyrinogen oxidase